MRSVHFISFAWFVGFILAHGAMVFVTGIRQNTNHMFGGVDDNSWTGFPLFLLAMAVMIAAWLVVSPLTIRYARLVQRTGAFMIGWLMGLAEGWDPRSQLTKKDISPYFWPNGTMPNSREFDDLVAENFAGYRLRIDGLVEIPREFSLAELKAMAKQEQITTHFCIQGWSGVAEWGGVPMRDILDLVKPMPEARYAVFYSLADGADGGRYYDVHKIENMRHKLTILAYEMNGEPVSVLARRCGCAARTSSASRWSNGSSRSNSFMTFPTWAPATAATMRTTNSTATVCRFDRFLRSPFQPRRPICDESEAGARTMIVKNISPRALERLAVTPVREAAALMSKPHTDLIVVCDHGDMVGVLTKTDIVGDQPLHGFRLHGEGGQHHDARRHLLPDTRGASRCLVVDEGARSATCSDPRRGTQAARHHLCAGNPAGSAVRIGERRRAVSRLHIRGRLSVNRPAVAGLCPVHPRVSTPI